MASDVYFGRITVALNTLPRNIRRAKEKSMNGVDLGQVLLWVAFIAVCWFCYQLFMQNGRLQLRLEALEQELQAQGIIPDKEREILKGVACGSVVQRL